MSINEVEYEHVCHDFEKLASGCDDTILGKNIVHKYNSENVFVKDLRMVSSNDQYDGIATLFHIPLDHPFFFEHPKDHIPGLMLIDAGKQAGTAMCHKIYKVDFKQVFILDNVIIRFLRLTTVSGALFGYNHITEKKYRSNQLVSLQAEGYFFQSCKKIAYMKCSWKIMDPAIFNRIKDK